MVEERIIFEIFFTTHMGYQMEPQSASEAAVLIFPLGVDNFPLSSDIKEAHFVLFLFSFLRYYLGLTDG